MAFYQTDTPLNPDIFIFRMLTNKTTLTTSSLHDIFAKIFSPHHQAMPQHIFLNPYWLPSHDDHFSSPLIGHQDTWLIRNSSSLISIPGICIALYAFMTSRSLTQPSKPCLILLKNILYLSIALYMPSNYMYPFIFCVLYI